VWEVEELEGQLQEGEGQLQEWEGQLQEREELDDITLHRELEVLSTRETSLKRCEAELEQERKALEDARAQILA
jgi:predicted  nucleic acid-binding Zn-ribbon protein